MKNSSYFMSIFILATHILNIQLDPMQFKHKRTSLKQLKSLGTQHFSIAITHLKK